MGGQPYAHDVFGANSHVGQHLLTLRGPLWEPWGAAPRESNGVPESTDNSQQQGRGTGTTGYGEDN